MKNRQTDETMRIHEIEGVYYMKMKVGDVPNGQPTTRENIICAMKKPEDFPRRG